jgi:AcrR family transcriptional regulator
MSRSISRNDTARVIEGGATIAQAAGRPESRDTLNRERVVIAAMDLADEGGIESVTMRELGRKLGVEAASLYNHVAGKDDLLNGMVDLVVAEIDLPSREVDWKEAMRRRAVSAREVFARHPWGSALIDSRGRSGPSSLSYADRVLGTMLDAGFSPRLAANAFLALDSYIYGFERQRQDISPADDEETADVAREVLAAIPPGAYPSLARVATEYAAEPYDDDAAFSFGLELILDGVERLLE